MFQITSKLEINLLKNSGRVDFSGSQLSTFIIKNKIPAVVCSPELVEIVAVDRSQFSYAYKIYCAVDFDDGRNYGLDKVRNLPRSCLLADGFEIRLTAGRNEKETLNEMRGLTEFFKQINVSKEIRWALSLRGTPPSQFDNCLKNVKKWPASMIRTDVNVDSPLASLESHVVDVSVVRNFTNFPVKISGDVDYDTVVSLMSDVARFDVSLDQARSIIRNFKDQRRISSEVEVEDEVEV